MYYAFKNQIGVSGKYMYEHEPRKWLFEGSKPTKFAIIYIDTKRTREFNSPFENLDLKRKQVYKSIMKIIPNKSLVK